MIKKTIRVTLLSLKNKIKSVDTIIVILFLLSYFSFIFPSSCHNVMDAKESVNIATPFIHGYLLRDFQIITLLGLVMMLGARNTVDSNKVNVLMRVEKTEWYVSEILTMIVTCILYTGVIFILSMLFYFPVLTIANGWGTGVESYRFFNNVLKAVEEMLQRNVFGVFFQAFVLILLVEIMLGAICLLCDTLGKKRMGPIICGGLIVWNLIARAAEWIPGVFSPIGMLTGYASGTFGYNALYLLVLNMILINGIFFTGKKSDAI
ncbi:MAG: hypothetical protein J5972_03055 [Eubacterium sp.]|nr:hypothetical protein [Eubacterium sp.]